MLALYRLISYVDALPQDDTYRLPSENLLKHLRKIPDSSIEKLAEICATSTSTINRLVRKIGCSNYSEFRRDIRDAILSYDLQVYKMANYDPASASVPDNMSNAFHLAVDSFKECLSVSLLDDVYALIEKSRSVHFYADARDCCITPCKRQLQLDLIMSGKDAVFLFNSLDCIADVQNLNQGSLLIIPCAKYVPAFALALSLIQQAHKNGAKIIVIAERNTPHIAEYADLIIEYTMAVDNFDGSIVDWIIFTLAQGYSQKVDRRAKALSR